ncbi:class I SAM-dependent methyltransferase [Streptomyces sp. NPDC059477]|uniref:class I SAM-dependent methyltransferase n=1 Tax=Streptomyces sp. NPDC059477 TaxID=3346847 RepID=UPI003676880F
MEAVSYTAQWTAAARAVESERTEGAMFTDDLARPLAAPRGFELLDKYGGGGLLPYIAIRTKYLDDSIEAVLAEGDIRQVVFVAAGMDTRAHRLTWPEGTFVYEVDHAGLIEEKAARLNTLGAQARVERRPVPADLAGDWLPLLAQAGHASDAPTLWVVEGLFFFLTEEQAKHVLHTLGRVSAPGSRLATDMVNKQMLRSPFNQTFLRALREDGTPWVFGTDEPEEFLSAGGWQSLEVKQPGDPGAGEHRWPYAVQPRDRRGVPRSWLIRAERVNS